jgi:microcystin-dependent protein
VQGHSTAAPHNLFSATIPHVPTDEHNAYSGSNADMLMTGVKQTFSSQGGGDAETRPINAYVNFIIKIEATAAIPTGTALAFAGSSYMGDDRLKRLYLSCNGSLLEQSQQPELFKAIGTAHGGSGDSFNVPDYRAYFLRGADAGANRDPDTLTRIAMNPGGSTGDAVGTVQGYATALPINPFSITFSIGTADFDSDHCLGHDNSMWNSQTTQVALTASGGDHETRAVNVYARYYVLAADDPNSGDIFPIGGVICVPSEQAPSSSEWLLCDGASYPIFGQYSDLYVAISTCNGGGGENFNVPDYRGYFIRGIDGGTCRDPGNRSSRPGGATGDNSGTFQDYATARPQSSDIFANVPHVPSTDGENAGAIGGGPVAEWDGAKTVLVIGGDSESRPINAAVHFYIKWAFAKPSQGNPAT